MQNANNEPVRLEHLFLQIVSSKYKHMPETHFSRTVYFIENKVTLRSQPHQMCSVEDLDKEEEGTSHPVRTARSHSRSGRLQQIPWSYYQG